MENNIFKAARAVRVRKKGKNTSKTLCLLSIGIIILSISIGLIPITYKAAAQSDESNASTAKISDNSNGPISKKGVIILSSGILPYKETLEGIQGVFSNKGLLTLFSNLTIYDYHSNPRLAEHMIMSKENEFIVTIGPEAAIAASKLSHLPLYRRLYLMVLDLPALIDEKGACGIDLRIPPKIQLKEISSRLKGIKSIGVMFNHKENHEIIKRFQEASSQYNINIRPIPVSRPRDCPELLRKNKDKIDAVLFIPDSVVSKETLLQYLIKEAILLGISPIGYNKFFMDSGAVMSFIINYQEIGRVGAQLLKKGMQYKRCEFIPPPYHIEWNKKAWDIVRQR